MLKISICRHFSFGLIGLNWISQKLPCFGIMIPTLLDGVAEGGHAGVESPRVLDLRSYLLVNNLFLKIDDKDFHMRHFGTQYCNKNIFLSHRFEYPTKVSSEKNVTYLPWAKSLPWPKETYGSKLSFYCYNFLSKYCAPKCLVWIRP